MSYLDKSGLKAIGTRWIHTDKGDAANPFVRARLVAQESKRVGELTRENASSTFAATPPLESLKFTLSRCTTGTSRQPADVSVLGFYDIRRVHRHSPARGTIVIKVTREDDECKSGYAIQDTAMYGTNDAAQCFDVASENTMTAMEFSTETFSPCLYPSSASDMSVFRHGDDFVVSWHENT